MVTVGLVRELTAEAARQAALGAGARLVGTFAYRLTAARRAPDRAAGAGHPAAGRRHRRRQQRGHPAQRRRARPQPRSPARSCSRATASAMDECRERLAGRAVIVTENVMPEFNVLDIEPARARDPRRVHRPHRARQGHRPRAGDVRPRADAHAGGGDGRRAPARRRLRRAARGSARCWWSIPAARPPTCTRSPRASPAGRGVIPQGLPEPRVKRTVEGDLGMRHNIAAIDEAAGVGCHRRGQRPRGVARAAS